ncbi:hypothetical protein NDU88_001765 [Pleurodeles waltl]|uniref:Uncharacterized protein n=1 Tax=Pleurodeles waltl TaxID=8319 RepID=A0AAV7LYK2_PLEWA|nr:hypothetical protein NDU88_001765 [Pleurodeles waltl]
MARMTQATVTATDHEYSALPSTSTQALSFLPQDDASDDSHSPHSDSNNDTWCSQKRRRHSPDDMQNPSPSGEGPDPNPTLNFDSDTIIHPRSVGQDPPAPGAEYEQTQLRKTLEKEVRNHLRSECPCPDIPGKVALMPELDPNLATFIKPSAKDPKKGIDRYWKSCQGKALDPAGPLCKNLELAVGAEESGSPIDPEILAGWAQRALCMLRNSNSAVSIERRHSILLLIDPKLADQANAEPGPLARS